MLVSALLTSVGINFALCVLFFTLYSVLRKQPSNYEVYNPRLLAEGTSKKRSRFNIERLIPSPGWVKKAWELSEGDILSLAGLDGLVFMRIITFSLKVFVVAGVLGLFVLLPVNCTGDQLQEIDFTNLSNSSLDLFTISNVKSGSKSDLCFTKTNYVVEEYNYISLKRNEFFNASKPQPNQFTILVRSIPVSPGSTISETVETFFKELHPSTYLSHVVVHRSNRIRHLVYNAKQLYKKLLHLQSDPNSQNHKRSGMFGSKVDLIDQYEKKLENIEENVRLEQSQSLLAGDEVRAAFVSFKTRYGAGTVDHMQQSANPINWITEQAPEPHDVYWPFFSSSFMRRWICKLMVIVACIVLTVLFIIPVVIVQGLTNLSQLEIWLPFLKSVLTLTFVSQVITGYLPSLILQLFLKIVPPIMEFLSSVQGYISNSDIVRSACNKVLWFTIWNVFFATVFSGSILNQISIFLDPRNIPEKLAVAVPAQASFFIAYVVTSGWTSTSSELFRIIPLIFSLLTRCCKSTEEEVQVPPIAYHKDIPRILFFGLLGITYFFLAPLILPFLLIYLCLAYIVYRNQFVNVYAPKYDSAGKFWPIVHNSMIFSLVLMHCIAIGIFALKKLPVASYLIFPLPILTLLFNEYSRKRFLPNFIGYSAEVLIKKDRQDEDDPSMDVFFNRLVTAYQDPALEPIRLSANGDSLKTPLIASPPREVENHAEGSSASYS
ncbi:hypothetical protein ACFE04_025094 [Oxalis oulophora]